jgi:hypothetical protein
MDCGHRVTGMDDLVTWYLAQLDEDERVAKAASVLSKPPWSSRITRDPDGYVSGRIVDDRGYTVVHVEDQTPGSEEAEHIARWDPARVLAEVDAKRQLLDWLDRADDKATDCDYFNVNPDEAVRLLALPYADRPGYREEWRP